MTGVVADGTLTATVETDAEDCHLDVTCYPEWSSSATGVALIVIETNGSSSACSGTLLNNRRQDLTPYFLTAAHCVQTEEEARSVTAFWSYQTRTCNGDLPDLRSVPRTEGAGLLSALGGAGHPDGDITLLQLEDDLPAGTVFQGWNAAPQPVGSRITGIHHPASADWGRFKRISFGQIISESEFVTSDDTYFNVSWPVGQGYTEPGSSGSAVFSNSETVVGALSGGDIVGYACPTEPVTDYFTHFSAFYPHIRSFIDNMLSPGQPVAFRLGPVDSPMLFSGDSSFQVEVPEGAARVTFTLESVDPDVNVDLYVRYGEDNAVQGGSVVSDYSSTGSHGQRADRRHPAIRPAASSRDLLRLADAPHYGRRCRGHAHGRASTPPSPRRREAGSITSRILPWERVGRPPSPISTTPNEDVTCQTRFPCGSTEDRTDRSRLRNCQRHDSRS